MMIGPASRFANGAAASAVRGSGLRGRMRRAARAFTLLELLLVMSILAILASITLVVGRGITERSKVAQAKAEMAVLAAALEQYKQHYGDYPWTPDGSDGPALDVDGYALDGGAVLFNALCGNLGPRGNVLSSKGRTFIDLARFAVDKPEEASMPLPGLTTLRANWVNDPWGKWYYYHYKKGPSDADFTGRWKSRGFLLYSHGPDGECDVGGAEDSGLLEDLPGTEPEVTENRDNIYYGRD
ncbi:MAG: prepilin-type N-terminal cleavage/methylation domain-containing protein [Opitutaceae bacterium]|nr:prepilin-type N-terminal cleavage/methylation domain-containing protein [Opitutaceae bacterium]